MKKTLNLLKVGDKCCLTSINNNKEFKNRLLELGLTPGTLIECMYISPFNDPIAYKAKDTILALRKNDSKNIIVETLNEN